MKTLFFGDIVGRPGRRAVAEILPKWRKKYDPDLVVANGENIAHGKGITEPSLRELFDAGIDLVTAGDHTYDQKGVARLLENKDVPLIRPANYSAGVSGNGWRFVDVGTRKVLVVNLIGRVFMKAQYDDPFRMADKILDEEGERANIVIVDFHAEATAEKVCLGWYLDGRVSAVLGTHTHIPTADGRILPKGTAYISDVGMVGVRDSSLGVDKDIAVQRYLTQINQKLEIPEGPVEVNAILLEFGRNGKAKSIKQVKEMCKIEL